MTDQQDALFDLDDSQTWVSYSEFAKNIGVSAEAVRKAIKNDRFDWRALKEEKTKTGKVKYKINLSEGRIQWEANRYGADQSPSHDASKNDAKQREATANANIAELKYQEMDGQLIRTDAVKIHFSKIATNLREAFLSLPVRVSPELADLEDPVEIENKLKEHITVILKELADAGRSGKLFK